MTEENIFKQLDDLATELNVTEEWLKNLWAHYVQFNWMFCRMVKEPIAFPTMTEEEKDEEYATYANAFNNSDFSSRERIYKRFVSYCKWVAKSL